MAAYLVHREADASRAKDNVILQYYLHIVLSIT